MLRRLAGPLAALAALCSTKPAGAGETRHFEHADERYLLSGQRKGGAVFVPSAVDPEQPVPLVVFLHGTNPRGRMHPWLGGSGSDLRALAESLIERGEVAPLILAGPTQSHNAVLGTTMWSDFDLKQFVHDVEGALGSRARIDERAVALFGHSGAGCNPNGGLAGRFVAGEPLEPIMLVAIDPCLDAELGAAIAANSPDVPFWLLWQTATWRRDFEGWLGAAAIRPSTPRATELEARGRDPHDEIVPVAVAAALRELFPAETPSSSPDTPDSTQPADAERDEDEPDGPAAKP